MKVSFTGNVTHSIRSINVRANILSEWTVNQARFHTEMLRYTSAIAICCAVAGVLVPISERARGAYVAEQTRNAAALAELKVELADAQASKKTAEPGEALAEIRAETTGHFNRLLGEVYQVLDSAKSGMAFSAAKVDVREAEIVIDCRADAETYDVAAAFAEQAGSTPNKISNLASTRPNALLGANGLSFEYIKRVGLQ